MDGFGNFDEEPNNMNYDNNDEDAFSAAQDPFNASGGMQMSSQSQSFAATAPMGSKHDDLTPEEIEIIERVDSEQQNRKRELYEKLQQEENEKNDRKLAG